MTAYLSQPAPASSEAESILHPEEKAVPAVVEQAIQLARTAQTDWASCSIKHRLSILRKLRHTLAESAESIAASVERENHRTMAETLSAEVMPTLEAIRFLEKRASKLLATRRERRGRPIWLMGTSLEIQREPFGIVLIIAPSNYPFMLPAIQALQALAAGNAVLVKPAVGCSQPMHELQRFAESVGLPKGVLQVLDESPETAQTAIAIGVDKIILTGSAATGKKVAALAAKHLTPAEMELSGCDSCYVLPSADIERTARALAFGMTLNAGQTCIAPRRVFVSRDRVESLLEALKAQLSLRIKPVTLTGPHLDRVRQALDQAEANGALLHAGGFDEQGLLHPTIVTAQISDLAILRDDLFAPVICLCPVDSIKQARELDNHCPYALGSSIFGQEQEARELAKQIDAGCVTINDLIVPISDPRLPFSPRHQSGFGVTRGEEGLLAMTRIKAITHQRLKQPPHFDLPRHDDAAFFSTAIRAFHSQTIWRRLASFWQLIPMLRQRASQPSHTKASPPQQSSQSESLTKETKP